MVSKNTTFKRFHSLEKKLLVKKPLLMTYVACILAPTLNLLLLEVKKALLQGTGHLHDPLQYDDVH